MTAIDDSAALESVELRASIVAVSRRITSMEAERSALEEVCDDLQMREHGLSERVSIAQRENSALSERIQAALARISEIDAQSQVFESEIARLKRLALTHAHRADKLGRELAALRQELGTHKGHASNVDLSLKTIQESLASMDQKIGFARRKGSPLISTDRAEIASEPLLSDLG